MKFLGSAFIFDKHAQGYDEQIMEQTIQISITESQQRSIYETKTSNR